MISLEELTMGKALEITVVSLVVVFAVLILLMLILESFKYFFKADIAAQEARDKVKNQKFTESEKNLPVTDYHVDKETEMVAILTALIMASEDEQDKHYQVESVRLIK